MGSGIIAGAGVTYHQTKLNIYSDNASASIAPNGAAYADLKTKTLSTAQADYAALIVRCEVYANTNNVMNQLVYFELCNGTTLVGGETQFTILHAAGGDIATGSTIIERTFTAGTDYTRATGFTVALRSKGLNSDVYCKSMVIEAITD